MSTLKKELIEGAIEVFATYPKENVILATSDGTFFLMSAKSLARDHARKQSLDEPIEITRQETEETPELTPEETPELTPVETPELTPVETPDPTPEVTPDPVHEPTPETINGGANHEVSNHEKPVAVKKAKPAKRPVPEKKATKK